MTGKKLPIETLSKEEVLRLIGAASAKSSCGLRTRALLVVLYRAMIRLGEALALKEKDLDFERGLMTVLHGKGDVRRVVSMDPLGWSILQAWIERRRRIGLNGSHPVFCSVSEKDCSKPGSPMDPAYVRRTLKRLAKKAGIAKRVHPHGLRHTGTKELAEEGVPVHLIRDQLGHSSIATTDRYLRAVAPTELAERIQRRRWGDDAQDQGVTPEEFSGV